MTAATRRSWVAVHDTACGTCAGRIVPGDRFFFAAGGDVASGLDCCGDRPDEDLVVRQRSEEDGLSAEDDPRVTIARTLPRGKTAADKCPKCWQIPSSSGTCGCDM